MKCKNKPRREPKKSGFTSAPQRSKKATQEYMRRRRK